MLRTTLLNGITTEKDKDYTALGLAILGEGIIEGLQVTTNQVATGSAFIKATRTSTTPNEEILVKFEVTANEVIDTSGTKKVWIEILQDNINDAGLNDANGTTAGSIETGASYPAGNYIPLADIVAGVITDEREDATIFARNLAGLKAFLLATSDGAFEVQQENGTLGEINLADILIDGAGIGTALGLATLDGTGKVPLSQLPSASVPDASETVKGIVERATDAEALAWTDTTRYINAKQLKVVSNEIGNIYPKRVYTATLWSISANSTNTVTHNLWVTEAEIEAWKYKVYFSTAAWNWGEQPGDTSFSTAQFWEYSTIKAVKHQWQSIAPTVPIYFYWQANSFQYKWGTTAVTNARIYIEQIY